MKQLFKNIFFVLSQKEKKRFARLVALDILVSILDILFLALLLFIIDFYSHPTGSSANKIRLFLSSEKYKLLPVVIFFLLFSLKNMFAFFISKMQFRFTYHVASRISRNRLLTYMQGSYTDYVQTDSAVFLRNIYQQPMEFCNYVLRSVQQVISQVMLIILILIPVLIYNATLFPLLLIILLPAILLAGFIIKKKLNEVRISARRTGEQSWQYLKEALAGYIESNTYEKKYFFLDRYSKMQSKLNGFLARQQTIQNLPSRLIEVFAIFGLVILIILNRYNNNEHGIDIITIAAFVAAAYKIIPGVVNILNSIGQIKTYSFTIAGLADNKEETIKQHISKQSITSIEFRKVAFKYDGIPVFNDISFTIETGSFAGIAATSGKGKTTIMHLLLGFLEQDSGDILINGIITDAKERQQYWKHIAYVKQQSFLIHDTILKNITLSDAGYDDKKLQDILKITGVDKIIEKADEGIHTMISEEGKNFSGGQRQRIILARALYKDCNTIMLDEPFNELDEPAETVLLGHLKNIAASGKIVILVTHNKEALSFCNQKIMISE